MSLRSGVRVGSQEPRVRVRPAGCVDFYDGDEAVELSAGYGLTPDPWQGDGVVRGWLARGADGRLAAGRCGLAVPRQNGKNGTVEVVQLHKLVVQGRKILHTAHEVKTARKAFLRLCSFFENERKYPELAALVESIRRTNGQEAIVLLNGASVEFVARSRGSGRGYTVDDLFCDEAQEMDDEQLEALLPTVSAAPSGDPQIIFLGTPPGPNSPGEVFQRVRSDAVSGQSVRLCWDEWSIPDEMPVRLALENWREHVYHTNPALGIRLGISTVTDESVAMSAEGFCRERLGQWQNANAGARAFSVAAWGVLRGEMPEGARLVYGVKFSVDGSSIGLAEAYRPVDGPVFVRPRREANLGEGIGWLVDFLVANQGEAAQIVIDGRAGVGALVNALRDGGVKNKRIVIVPTLDQVLAAHSMFEQAVVTGGLSHPGNEAFDLQVTSALKRKIGANGGFGWDAPEGGSVVALDAATLAHWGAKTTKRNPGRRVGGMVM
jgi:hypothetical protein